MAAYFTKESLFMSQAPEWNFELNEDELLSKALELGFVKQVANDKFEMNEDYKGKTMTED